MTDEIEQDPAPPARPATCKADLTTQFATCERCGIAWDPRLGGGPDCAPMTPKRIRAVLEKSISRQEASHEAAVAIQRDDPRAADPVPALMLAIELRSVLRFVDRVLNNRDILDILRKTPVA